MFGETGHAQGLADLLGRERTQIWRYLTGRAKIPKFVDKLMVAHRNAPHA